MQAPFPAVDDSGAKTGSEKFEGAPQNESRTHARFAFVIFVV
jgi:hypothetical protein